jgi:hypothetical protein
LIVLRNDESTGLFSVATGDESGFSYRDESMHCHTKSREKVQPRTKTTTATERGMVTIFFTGTKLLTLDAVPRDKKFDPSPFFPLLHENYQRKT